MTCNHIVHAVHGHGAMCIGPPAETPCVRMSTFSLCVPSKAHNYVNVRYK